MKTNVFFHRIFDVFCHVQRRDHEHTLIFPRPLLFFRHIQRRNYENPSSFPVFFDASGSIRKQAKSNPTKNTVFSRAKRFLTPQNAPIRGSRTEPTTLLPLISPGLARCTPGRTNPRSTGSTGVQPLGECVNPREGFRTSKPYEA